MAADAILDFSIREILLPDWVHRSETHHCVKFSVIFHLFAQKPPPLHGGISTKFYTAVEVVDVVICDQILALG